MVARNPNDDSTETLVENRIDGKIKQQGFQRYVALRPAAYIQAQVDNLASKSQFLNDENNKGESEMAIFQRNEIRTCRLLGNGAFSEVHQIRSFRLSDVIEPDQDDYRCEYLQQTAIDSKGRCRYALKHLRRDMEKSEGKFHSAAADLVLEAKFLSRLDHPNIIKIRGWSGGPESYNTEGNDGFFLILDRLDETLSHRIKRWQSEASSSPNSLQDSSNLSSYKEKLSYGLQLAQALDYLHDRDMIFRDLKTDNIGFEGDTLKMFDFGLCRELPEECPDEHKTFRMSGVGTRRYMAPEVYLGLPYNLKADIYSWTMVFHAMISLQRPFANYDAPLHRTLVCEKGARPIIKEDWPNEIQNLLLTGWSPSPDSRPSIKQVCRQVEGMIQVADSQEAMPSQRTTTLMEASLDLMNHVCEDIRLNKHASQLLRLLEMQMMDASTCSRRDHKSTDYPHFQHLRSSYL
jgi:serine/threonine protein kinase